ncbi:MAG: BamA/TamA family outer membrane protein [candidate division KSB1 bacterium]|nr:BamA/TamA family outer membrane protein [candidate division KSB1 bacterium]
MEGRIITGIVIMGNERTHEEVIRREMKTRIGDIYRADRLEEDRKRIQNLALFTRVEYVPAPAPNEGVTIVIIVAERWHFFPYPLVFRNERSWQKWSYGLGVIHNNIAGWNQKAVGELWFGYNPGGQFAYLNPWIGGDRHFFYKIQVLSAAQRSKMLNMERFDETHRGVGLIFGRQWGYHTSLYLQAAYEEIGYPADKRHLLPSGSSRQSLPSIGAAFLYDRRDLYEYPRSGYYFRLFAEQYYWPEQVNCLLYGADCRSYFKLTSALSLALRLDLELSAGEVPVFKRRYLGYLERVRGRFFEAREGENLALFSSEFRFPILPIRYLDLSGTGIDLGKYQRDLPFGLSGAFFFDAGEVWWNRPAFNASSGLAGYGAGLHVHLPYVELLRIEYAFGIRAGKQWIIDLQVSF